MSVRFVVALIALLLAASGLRAQEGEGVEVDAQIVLAVDVSRSMDMRELGVQREGYTSALRHPDLVRAVAAGRLGRVAIAYFEWSGQAQDGALIPWRIIDGPTAAAAMADEIESNPISRSRGTSISRALHFAAAMLDDGTVIGERQVIDVSGDGANNIGPPVTSARDELTARGITINGLPIMASSTTMPYLDRYYEDCVIGGIGAFVLAAHTGEDLARTIRRKLILEISGLAPEPRIVPAQFETVDCLIGEKTFRWRGYNLER